MSGPSRIEVQVSSTSSDNSVVGQIVAPNGSVVATGRYDTPGGGNYAVRVCSLGSSIDPPTIDYHGLIGTGPAGQPVLTGPAQPQASTNDSSGGVLGTSTTVLHSAKGKGAVMTRAGFAWFTLNAVNNAATLRVVDPIHHSVRLVRGLHAAYGTGVVTLTGNGVLFRFVRSGSRLTYSSPVFRASGRVVRGSFRIAV